MGSPFEVLRVDPDADEEEIVAAYRRRVKEAHPDQGGTTEEFQRVKEAYEALTSGEYALEAAAPEPDTVEAEPASEETVVEAELTEVEYLNYDALEDFGWRLDDADLFEKAAAADLDATDYGTFEARRRDTLLEAAEDAGFTWPYSCRGGACANCAVAVIEGDLSMPANHILPPEMTARGIQLSCVATPITDDMQVVFNVKHLPELDELRLPPGPFKGTNLND
jgi:curved DNA-binding protein CbpA